MFLTDFHTQKYTGSTISWVGIFLTVTPGLVLTARTFDNYKPQFRCTSCCVCQVWIGTKRY